LDLVEVAYVTLPLVTGHGRGDELVIAQLFDLFLLLGLAHGRFLDGGRRQRSVGTRGAHDDEERREEEALAHAEERTPGRQRGVTCRAQSGPRGSLPRAHVRSYTTWRTSWRRRAQRACSSISSPCLRSVAATWRPCVTSC